MPIDYSDYPANWFTEIRPTIIARANNCCEGSPKFPECRAENYKPHPVTGSKVILTIAHVDHDVENNDANNLRAWCQRCHLAHDEGQRANSRRFGRNWKKNQLKLFPSEEIRRVIDNPENSKR